MKTKRLRVLLLKKAIRFMGSALLLTISALAFVGCEDVITPVVQEDVRLAGLPEYTLTILPPATGSVTPSGEMPVKQNEPVTVTAVAPNLYSFLNWEVIDGGANVTIENVNSSTTTVRLSGGDAVIQPIITDTLYDLTMTNDGHGTTDPTGTIQVANGQPRTISIASAATGYEFDYWITTSGTATFSNDHSATTTTTVTGGAATIQARFKLKQYTITMSNDGNGTTSPGTTIIVTHGQPSATITATANTGYDFSSWTGPAGITFASATASSTTFTATAGNATIKANFIPETYSMTLAVSGPGTITTPSTSPVSVTYNVARSIVAGNPSSRGYYFSGWSKTAGSGTATFANATSKSTTVTVAGGDVTIAATFSPITASITYVGSLNLNGSPYTEQRLDVVNDILYEGGYIYAVGSFSGTAKLLKIDASSPSSPAFDSSHDIAASSVANQVIKESPYLYIGVSGTNGDRYRTTIKTGSGLNSFTDMGHNVSVLHVSGGGWISDSRIISKYYVHGTVDVGSDDPIADILYIPAYNYLYVTRAAGMSSDGRGETYYDYNDAVYNESSYLVTNRSPGKMTYGGQDYIYAASGASGVITFYVDYEVFDDVNVLIANANTGDLLDADANGNYLYSIGTGTTDRLAIFDIHSDNGSISAPYYINGTNRQVQGVKALDAEGSYLYTIEGTYLVIYQVAMNTP